MLTVRHRLAAAPPPGGGSAIVTATLAGPISRPAGTHSRRTRACATAWLPYLTESAPRARSDIRSPADRPYPALRRQQPPGHLRPAPPLPFTERRHGQGGHPSTEAGPVEPHRPVIDTRP